MSSGNSTYVATSGEAYHRFLGRWTGDLAAALTNFAAPRLDGALLDAGCGTGSLARVLAARMPDRDVTGVDIAEPYVAYARSLGGSDRLTYATASATAVRR
jgi:2-polyprenyl-3-methyl-5-hydroxy-6-metoxy-1,4-benzoquinol methylase